MLCYVIYHAANESRIGDLHFGGDFNNRYSDFISIFSPLERNVEHLNIE